MTFISLPQNYNSIDIINIKYSKYNTYPFLSKTVHDALKKHKSLVSIHKDKWDMYKKYINPYEYIHTIIPTYKISVSNYKPISRSYYKLIEIYNTFDLKHSLNVEKIKTFHLAEGPGGFIEAIIQLRDNINDNYYGMTIINKQDSPGWKYTNNIFKQNLVIEKGIDNTGDILSPDNFKYIYEKHRNTMDLITADGGFDFSNDYNGQEINSSKLIFAEIIYGILLQKQGGTFIIKIYDSFSLFTLQSLYLLTSLYNNVYIHKPDTSRCANSEKYVICKNFKHSSSDQYFKTFYNILQNIQYETTISNILRIDIPLYFINVIEEINSQNGSIQIEYINKIVASITNSNFKYNNLINLNIKKCMLWCSKNNIPYNNMEVI